MKTLPVVFRIDRAKTDRQITAVFPTTPGTGDPTTMQCYAHLGQHGACSLDWYYSRTRPATPEQYAPLLAELRGIYESGEDAVTLDVRRFIRAEDRAALLAELRKVA